MEPAQYAAPQRSTSSKQSSRQKTLSEKLETKVGALKLDTAVANLFTVLNNIVAITLDNSLYLSCLFPWLSKEIEKFAPRSGMCFAFKD